MDTPAKTPKDVSAGDARLRASVGPHISSGESVEHIMWTVSAALLPAAALSVYYFGVHSLLVMAVSIGSAVAFEALAQRMAGQKVAVSDGSGFLTGLLLAMNLPAGVPLYLPVVGSAVAIIITKQLFGGLGFNIFNPALIGRAFLLASWPRYMTTWPVPHDSLSLASVDATTAATPLAILKEEGYARLLEHFASRYDMYTQMILGHRGGALGEVSAIALLFGAAYLLYKGYITWHIPVSFIFTVGALTWIFGGDPVLAVFSGGLILGAFFMATDYVTAPMLKKGQVAFGVGCGALTVLIRLKGGYPEGVCYAILLMNCFTPLLDRAFRPSKFGAAGAKVKV
ncbi:MAG: RnfABCDGE type electron transport complex subunit D [Nitrospirae bacterium]|nr:RnfABCDGE type electron transport complex subunit D [Nitrospirota bacterium]MBI5694478.1 RnfABCDGE type electron transport complex subunit D [Nitrospirota bacterium]